VGLDNMGLINPANSRWGMNEEAISNKAWSMSISQLINFCFFQSFRFILRSVVFNAWVSFQFLWILEQLHAIDLVSYSKRKMYILLTLPVLSIH
jgi:hypothetical protein